MSCFGLTTRQVLDMWEHLLQYKQEIEGTLSQTPLSPDSLYGLLMILILVGIGVLFCKKILRAISFGIGFLLLLQVLHVIAFLTPFGESYPVMQTLFKYEPAVALAQMFVGTPICDGLLWLQVFLNRTIGVAFTVVFHYGGMAVEQIVKTFEALAQ